ncbi:hypothetical protein [Paenibacillus radicis (ex Xue et al. 2023)]|uniref:Uncharacterized protein n=1 Tax=Paenibacillus radicis (ex Xue et al. 2023) TaxID=2972489 RepID=A0ABT1YH40_9BACL|nr:hypothetical protein [Paenibacillus radicis (ex Xue et al. 2023)]MCR8632497.1 hypothetical protein [Paenibacillus radicis (ex Xue et al. 2023)]
MNDFHLKIAAGTRHAVRFDGRMHTGLFFKAVQSLTGSGVYTVLLNVDFLPIPKWFGLPVQPVISLSIAKSIQ